MTYLLSTRLKEFWPAQAPAVLLGPWCLPAFGDDQGTEIHQGQMIPCPWSSNTAQDAYGFAQETHIKLLPKLCQALNKIHGVAYPDRYWQIVVGPWLFLFVHVIYDRLTRLKCAKEHYPDLKLIGLCTDEYRIPIDTLDFAHCVNLNDVYNLQLITQLAEKVGINIQSFREPKSSSTLTTESDQPAAPPRSIKLRAYEYLQKKLLPYASVVLYESYHSQYFLAQLFLLSKTKIINLPSSRKTLSPIKPDSTKREHFRKILFDDDGLTLSASLEPIILDMAVREIPLVFLEGHADLELLAYQEFGSTVPKVICSAIGWYFHEPFKCWSAKAAIRHTRLFGMQHGGNYGVDSCTPFEDHERAFTDGYLTWGWSEEGSQKPMVPTPAQKLLDIKHHRSENKMILFAITVPSRYLIFFPQLPDFFHVYLDWLIRFLKRIDNAILPLIHIRLHREDSIWDIRKRLEHQFVNLQFEGWELSFRESLADCRLFVCDHLSTTYAEALASNTPTVLFWNPETNPIRVEAQPIFEELRRVGILHDTPESAAAWVEKVYPNVSEWWNSKDCQKAVRHFCQHHARISPSPLKEWLNILNTVIKPNDKSISSDTYAATT